MKTNHLIRPAIDNLQAYKAAHNPDGLRLDNMESPWCSIDFSDPSILNALQQVELNRYPDNQQTLLKQRISDYFQVPTQQLLLGNGSDELIALTSSVIGGVNDVIISVEPTFSVYQIQSIVCSKKYISVSLNADFSLNLPAILTTIQQHQNSLIFLAYPNNPTGSAYTKKDILRIINQAQKTNSLVVIDEAYYAFAEESCLNDIKYLDNLIVLRTFSKVGFAGLRVGVLIAQEYWVNQINKARMPYNINTLSQVLLTKVLEKPQLIEQQAQLIIEQRHIVLHQLLYLGQIYNFKVYPSSTNFILFKILSSKVQENPIAIHNKTNTIYQKLKDNKIFIRNLSNPIGLLNGCLRVSISTTDENQIFINNLEKILEKDV